MRHCRVSLRTLLEGTMHPSHCAKKTQFLFSYIQGFQPVSLWSPWKSHSRHLLEMVMSRRKAPEPWPQPLAHGLSARHVRQILGRISSPWLPWDKMPTVFQAHYPGCIISDVWGQRASISSPDGWGTQEDRGVSGLGGFPGVQPLSLLSRHRPQPAGE